MAYRLSYNDAHAKMPPVYKIENFPLETQPDGITCGPTSCLMVMKYYGHDLTLDKVKAKTKTEWFKHEGQEVGMTDPYYIESAMKALNLPVTLMHGDLKSLKKHISEDKPVIILIRSSRLTWHYVVAIGYTETEVVIADPAYGKTRSVENSILLNAWSFSSDIRGNKMPSFDWIRILVEWSEARGYTLIVPKESKSDACLLQDQRQ